MSIQTVIFDVLALIAIFAASVVVVSNNPVRCALALVLTFFACAGIWLLAEAEFLALVLILVYVGAVMTLFLFVIMMLNIDVITQRSRYVRYLPFVAIIGGLLGFIMLYVVGADSFGFAHLTSAQTHGSGYSNIKELGEVLYTQYVFAFELAAVLLLVAIIAAISLSHREPRRCKTQEPRRQIQVNARDRVKLIKMSPSTEAGDPPSQKG